MHDQRSVNAVTELPKRLVMPRRLDWVFAARGPPTLFLKGTRAKDQTP